MFDFVPDHNPGPGADIWIYGHWPVLVQCLEIGTSSDLCRQRPEQPNLHQSVLMGSEPIRAVLQCLADS